MKCIKEFVLQTSVLDCCIIRDKRGFSFILPENMAKSTKEHKGSSKPRNNLLFLFSFLVEFPVLKAFGYQELQDFFSRSANNCYYGYLHEVRVHYNQVVMFILLLLRIFFVSKFIKILV